MGRAPLVCAVIAAACLAASPGPARAASMRFDFTGGFVTLSGTELGSFIVDPVTALLSGVQVTVDTSANQLDSILLTAPGPVSAPLNRSYAGLDTLTIQDLMVSGTGGTLTPLAAGPPQQFAYAVPVQLSVGVSGSGPGGATLPFQTIASSTSASGQLFVDPAAGMLSLNGITLGVIGPFSGETQPIVLKGDFVFTGMHVTPAIPEPTAMLVFALGVATVAGAVRRTQHRRNAGA